MRTVAERLSDTRSTGKTIGIENDWDHADALVLVPHRLGGGADHHSSSNDKTEWE
jgi:hypothetical protein